MNLQDHYGCNSFFGETISYLLHLSSVFESNALEKFISKNVASIFFLARTMIQRIIKIWGSISPKTIQNFSMNFLNFRFDAILKQHYRP